MRGLHPFIVFFYAALPVIAAAISLVWARRTRSHRPMVSFAVTTFSALLLGASLNVAYAYFTDSTPQWSQIALTCYLAVGVLSLLKGASWFLKEAMDRLFRVRSRMNPAAPPGSLWLARVTGAMLFRVLLLFGFGLPYIMAVAMVYRPKVIGGEDPRQQLHVPFERVSFPSTDDIPLVGWWMPASPRLAGRPNVNDLWGEKTVILCHGLGAGKANQLALARDLIPNGYNVLVFDFRAHGESGGQFTTFGDNERYDVLGAVRWLQHNHPEAARQIDGLGVSMGAAALLAAAGDDSPEGHAIAAVAVFSTFDDFRDLTEHVTQTMLFPPLGWLTRTIGLPMASLHSGADLMAFSPAEAADRLAPRPLLVVHGRGDTLIPFETGVRLFDRASQPKLHFWIGKKNTKAQLRDPTAPPYVDGSGLPADHNNVIFNDDAVRAVRLFFDKSLPML